MLRLICKNYLNITFLPRSSINRLLNFTYVYICFWFSVKIVLFVKIIFFFFNLFYFFISIRYLLKRKNDFKKKIKQSLPENINTKSTYPGTRLSNHFIKIKDRRERKSTRSSILCEMSERKLSVKLY